MKHLFKLKLVTLLSLLGLFFISCNENEISNEQFSKIGFDESVLILGEGISGESSKFGGEMPIKLDIVNFNPDFELEENYVIEGYHFSDDGKYNDEIAGDGIYTSLETFSTENGKSLELSRFEKNSIGGNFKFQDELNQYLENKGLSNKGEGSDGFGIKFSCKLRLVSCSGTPCWPWTTCTCIEYYDCEISIEVGLD